MDSKDNYTTTFKIGPMARNKVYISKTLGSDYVRVIERAIELEKGANVNKEINMEDLEKACSDIKIDFPHIVNDLRDKCFFRVLVKSRRRDPSFTLEVQREFR